MSGTRNNFYGLNYLIVMLPFLFFLFYIVCLNLVIIHFIYNLYFLDIMMHFGQLTL